MGLVGDNGAGKTTLIKILSGVHPPDEGEIRIEGRKIEIATPKQAMRLGIETIYQYQFHGPDNVDRPQSLHRARAAEGVDVRTAASWTRRRCDDDSVKAIADVDLHLRSPDALVGELSGGQRQGVAIARAMYFKSRLLILDEPTNHLSVKETNKVIGFVKALKHQNVTGIFISHNMHHVFQSCDRVVAMARGEVVFNKPIAETSIDEVADYM